MTRLRFKVVDNSSELSNHLLLVFVEFSGCNPNIQTIETEVLKTQAAARKTEFEKQREVAKHRLIMLEKSKTMKRLKEINEQRAKDEQKRNKEKPKEIKKTPQVDNIEINPFEENNPFSDDDSSNPFLEDDNAERNPSLDGETDLPSDQFLNGTGK